jgi:hypothetical protein
MSFDESMISAGFIQKTVKGTYSSKEITKFHCDTNVGTL